MKLSKNLTLREVTNSTTAKRFGLPNVPSEQVIKNLKVIAKNVFQPVRDHFGKPIIVSSGYRSAALNRKIGGARFSQHLYGQALDLDNDSIGSPSNKEIFEWIKNNLQFDQLIWEYGDDNNPSWVHVSYITEDKNRKNRNEVLKVVKTKNGRSLWTRLEK